MARNQYLESTKLTNGVDWPADHRKATNEKDNHNHPDRCNWLGSAMKSPISLDPFTEAMAFVSYGKIQSDIAAAQAQAQEHANQAARNEAEYNRQCEIARRRFNENVIDVDARIIEDAKLIRL